MNRTSAMPLALYGLLTLVVAIGIGRFAFTPILPMMQKDNGLTLRAAGLLASANYIGYFVGALSAIWIRIPMNKVVRYSMLSVAALTVAMGLLHDPFSWLLLRGLAGIASAWVLIFASAFILERLAGMGRKPLGGVVFGGVGSGIALAGVLCLVFVNLAWTADQAWIALGIAGLVVAAICWPAYRDATMVRAAAATTGPALRLRNHMTVIVCYGIFGFGYIITGTFLPAMAKQSLADPSLFGWAWPIFGAAAFISTLLAGGLSAKFPNRAIWAVSHLVMAAGVIMPIVLPGMAGIALSACFVGGTFMVATMTGMQEARILAPQHAPRLMAAMTAAFGIGQILGPLLVSAVADMQGGVDYLLGGAGILLVGSALALMFDRSHAAAAT